MENRNYQKEMEHLIASLPEGKIPRLLLHSCCGPCSTYVLETLSSHFEITVYYYNPNIAPAEEYYFREKEQARLIERLPARYPIKFQPAPYDPKTYYQAVEGLENEPEGGARCTVCFRLRLEEAARVAKEGGFDFFTTTLSISPHKDAQLLNAIGGTVAEAVGIPYLFSDFKKKNGFKRSTELTRDYGMYRQDYCGCAFSRAARLRQQD